mmetsp:Transcript_18384/g.25905  ORF Transcript_18384/g.25905 Transcript_18384/m.25905 type:complete len:245 (-) Transcript_18384:407-1141(-)|eukprot:CAMPEP_0184858412 /NCGR_PEP_ID=MMETSP0580-20130426/3519_1 /TAXON_ID=1118495 /ORGANISM="Dactyliosolen fragilissimus" /LENGTH=244 /DNA_ID=CAMNT_0027354541 /DNA_START=77 /DNA_END=811 /DNA_ORIENTATION=-
MSLVSSIPPLLPKVDAIIILDGDGNRLAGKYYGDFLTNTSGSSSRAAMTDSESKNFTGVTVEDLRSSFELQLQSKIQGIVAQADAAEVVTVMGKTAVFCGGSAAGSTGGDVRVVHVGPTTESELVLAHLCEGMYDALSNLMGGQTDRNMVIDNLELVFLLIDEHCDGGIILETDGTKLANSVLLRDEDEFHGEGAAGAVNGAGPQGGEFSALGGMQMRGDMTIAQAIRQAREQLMTNLAQRDGM